MELSCLNNIIGVSETDCECLIDGLGSDELAEVQVSNSGIFLDQLDGFNLKLLQGSDDCARGGLWDRALNAIRQAQKDFINGLFQCVGQTFKPRIDPLAMILGDSAYTGSHSYAAGTYAGIKIFPLQIKGGVIFIKRLGVIVNASVPVTIKIYSNEQGGTLVWQSSPANATANTLTWVVPEETIALPMWSYSRDIRYYLVYELDGTYQPKETKKDCGCGGVQRPYLRWMDFEGTKGTDPTSVDGFLHTASTNGLILDIDIKCKTSEVICNDERPIDFEYEPDAMGIAYAIRFRAAARLYTEHITSTNINRETMLDREAVSKAIEAWNAEYQKWVEYLCSNVEFNANGCWVCKDTATTLHKSHIRAV